MAQDAIIIHHGHCADGFAAAWAAHRALRETHQNISIIEAQYEQPVNVNIDGKDVYIVDFSFPPITLQAICEKANKVVVLDHHKSAIDKLKGFTYGNLEMILDDSRSGAMITWDYFFNSVWPKPSLINYVQDRDLWRFNLNHSREINSYISTFDFTLSEYDALERELEESHAFAIRVGEVLLKLQKKGIKSNIAKSNNRIGNVTSNISETGNELCGDGYSDTYFIDESKGIVIHSLRSNGVDVRKIAESKGGGGHPKAAGYTESLTDFCIRRLFEAGYSKAVCLPPKKES